MKIIHYKGKHPNFGDELNPWMWPRLIPDFFDDYEDNIFVGIGSILGKKFLGPYEGKPKIIFGAGFVEQYDSRPNLHTPDWKVYFVRGPRTARVLNIPSELALGDSAILLRTLVKDKPQTDGVVSFMPHFESVERGQWELVCRLAGINFIDPRRSVEEVNSEILRSRVVIAEAMHAAIVADSLRVPWVPLLPISGDHRHKWFDWAEALDMNLQQYRLWPSSLAETQLVLSRRPVLSKIVDIAAASPFSGVIETGLHHLAAHRLTHFSKLSPWLSDDKKIDAITDKMLTKVEKLRRDYKK